MSGLQYKRVLFKVSGEVLAGDQPFGINNDALQHIAGEIADGVSLGVEVAVVIGGGNIFRGISAVGIERSSADYMGMLATVMNGLALQNVLENIGINTRVQSAIKMQELAEGYVRRRAIRHLEKGRVVIFAGGTGNPYFSTDTAASLRAMEMNADIILKGTKVDGVYDKDPMKYDDAVKFEELTFFEVIEKQLKVMDATAITLCMDEKMPIIIFDIKEKGNFKKILLGEKLGTTVRRS